MRRDYSRKRRSRYDKPIKKSDDCELDWQSEIKRLASFSVQTVDFLSISGMAPKDFITDREYRPGYRSKRERTQGYIAKVGSKFYPNESITEQLVTHIGQAYGLKIADSKLRVIDGQVRFMSKYFVDRRTQLTHGAEIYEFFLGKEEYGALVKEKKESEHFTFKTTRDCLLATFLGKTGERIVADFVEMLTFDALIGHNDRHPYNWGILVPLKKSGEPRFSPVFDSARALFWNVSEIKIKQMLRDNAQLEAYVRNCKAPVSWVEDAPVDFFKLIGLIWAEYTVYRSNISKFLTEAPLLRCFQMIDKDYVGLLSLDRRELIKRCLTMRRQSLQTAIN